MYGMTINLDIIEVLTEVNAINVLKYSMRNCQ